MSKLTSAVHDIVSTLLQKVLHIKHIKDDQIINVNECHGNFSK